MEKMKSNKIELIRVELMKIIMRQLENKDYITPDWVRALANGNPDYYDELLDEVKIEMEIEGNETTIQDS